MGGIVFYICLILLVLLLVISSLIRTNNKKKARKQYLRDLFCDPQKNNPLSRPAVEPSFLWYLAKKHPERFVIDRITAEDLQIGDLFRAMNRCVSFPGMDMLYSTLFTDTGNESEKSVYEEAKHFISDKESALSCLEILDRIPRYADTDEFMILEGMSGAKDSGLASDLLVIVLLILSLVLVSFYPATGFAALVVMIAVGIASYFSGRRVMLEHLKGVSLSLRLIEAAHDLASYGRCEFSRYERLIHLCRFNGLISYRDGTSSDPLSILLDYFRMITHADIMIYKRKIAKIKKERDEILSLYRDIGHLDMCLSVASYISSKQCCGAYVNDRRCIEAKQLYHPLIADPVCNDISTCDPVLLTGSNASGKSTFLKAVGLNVLFAQNFGLAFAESFTSGAFHVYTSMAVRDDIKGGNSYYVVEARSIKRIVDASDSLSLCIIDEVLRGTNTVERIAASSALLRFLSSKNCLCFAATHDRELCTLLNDCMVMYHFTEEINEDNVTFPFLLKEGVSDRTNAIRLLDMLGFDQSIIKTADGLVARYKETGNWT